MEINWPQVIILFGTAFVCVVAYVKWTFNYWKRRNIPYLEASFPMGNFEIPWAIKKGQHEMMADIYREFKKKGYKHGGIFSSLRPVYVPIDMTILKGIMIKDFQHFVDRGAYYNEKSDPLSAHLFNIEGDKWRSLRTRLSPTFTSGRMKAMFQLVLDCGDGLQKEVEKLWSSNKPIDIKEIGALFTTNVIGTCAFGLDCNCFENPNNEFRIHSKSFFDGGIARFIRKFVTLSFPDMCRKFGVTVFPKETTKFYSDVTKNIMNHRETNNVKRNDFVQMLMDIKDDFTFNEIAAQAFVFFLAGFETSSSTMTFAFYEMAKDQEVQDKVRDEIRMVLEKHDGKLTYESINAMTYMSQVFDETLRKYPIVATLDRICTKTYQVPGEDLVIERGQKVLIPLKGIQYDPEFYPNPEKFDPERFTPENKAARHPCAYMPFGEGPRICIGMRFGVMQAKIGMAIMLKDYKYSLHPTMHNFKLSSTSPLLAPAGSVLLDIQKVD